MSFINLIYIYYLLLTRVGEGKQGNAFFKTQKRKIAKMQNAKKSTMQHLHSLDTHFITHPLWLCILRSRQGEKAGRG